MQSLQRDFQPFQRRERPKGDCLHPRLFLSSSAMNHTSQLCNEWGFWRQRLLWLSPLCCSTMCFTALSNIMIPTLERNWVPFYILLPQKGHFLLSTVHSWQQQPHKSCQMLFVDILSGKKSVRLGPAWSKQVNGPLIHVWRGRAAGIRSAAKSLQTKSSSWQVS